MTSPRFVAVLSSSLPIVALVATLAFAPASFAADGAAPPAHPPGAAIASAASGLLRAAGPRPVRS